MIPPPDGLVDVELRVAARPETVFRYFTDPERYRRWMGDRAELDPRPGGIYRVHLADGGVAEGRYVAIEPPSMIEFTWGWVGDPDVPPGSTTVLVTLRSDGDSTLLRLEHRGLPSATSRGRHQDGWRYFLGRLATEVGPTDPTRRT